ncbi:MAG: ABC transporter permease [Immundisolibacteraceae bacterium]|nr:ABC transporter permease [Immundisolibacteraceae bacterium]
MMSGQFAFLVSDYLIWAVTLIAAIWLLVGMRNSQQRQRWQMVLKRPTAMAAFILLMIYLLIALIDSIHYRPLITNHTNSGDLQYAASEVSVLDQLLMPLSQAQERSYSAPLAFKAFSKQQISTSSGAKRVYARLEHGGTGLEHEQDHLTDLLTRTGKGIGLSLLMLTPIALLFGYQRRKQIHPNDQSSEPSTQSPSIAWKTAAITLGMLTTLFMVATQLGSDYHLLGTDKVGQDVLLLGLKSIRTGILIGALTLLIMLPLALIMGTTAGYFGGRIDDLVQYLYTTLSSIPGVLLIAAAVLSINLYLDQNLSEVITLQQRADLRLLTLTGILGLTGWIGLCRLLRAESLKLRELDYVTAARAFGIPDWQILMRHLLPNLSHIVLITIVLEFSGLVLAEAVLSYVGVGVDPSMNSWGNMINGARLELAREPAVWWSLATAFVFMFTLVLSANLFADAVRDAFDPRLRGSQ